MSKRLKKGIIANEKERTCNKCLIIKPLNSFYSRKNGLFGVRSMCKACEIKKANDWSKSVEGKKKIDALRKNEEYRKKIREYNSERKKNNPEKEKRRLKKYWIENNYNITIEEYDAMKESQNNKCLICKKDESDLKKNLAVDHDHDTGRVRGLLCVGCNAALGLLKEDKYSCAEMVKYIEERIEVKNEVK